MQTQRNAKAYSLRRYAGFNIVAASAFVALFALSLTIGSVDIPLTAVLKSLWNKLIGRAETVDAMKTWSLIVNDIRLPRAVTAALVGASLAVSGCAMQGLLMNPLADGSILGISSGGTLGAVVFLSLGASLPPALAGGGVALFSMMFSFLSLLAVLALAWRFDKGLVTHTIILLGIVFSMLTGSITSLVIAFSDKKVEHLIYWMMGSLSAAKNVNLLWLALVSLTGIALLACMSRELNAFALGEEQAGYLGVNTKAAKLAVMVVASALIGASVSVSGMIGFVGLVPPHIVRLFAGSDHKRLIPSSALFGSAFLMLADLISRTAVRPMEIPIGVVTALAGSLLFLYLFNSMRGRRA